MNYQQLLDGIKKYGSNENDICLHCIGIEADKINKNVILAPWWEPSSLPNLGKTTYLSESDFSAIKVWDIETQNGNITYIKTGIGAPVLMDVVLGLGVTKCEKIIFVGSVGSLDKNIGIGDIVIPEYSICGDGASRYVACDKLSDSDVFGTKVSPNKNLFEALCKHTRDIGLENNVKYRIGRAFSIDSIFAQYAHIDEILKMGCNVIEMETASAFRAAEVADISMAAIFSVSDNTVINKGLISGRTAEEMEYRRFVRKELFPKIILKVFE